MNCGDKHHMFYHPQSLALTGIKTGEKVPFSTLLDTSLHSHISPPSLLLFLSLDSTLPSSSPPSLFHPVSHAFLLPFVSSLCFAGPNSGPRASGIWPGFSGGFFARLSETLCHGLQCCRVSRIQLNCASHMCL